MIKLFVQNKGTTRFCEDSLTASVIGIMQYLPIERFWLILKNALLFDKLPYSAGDILDIQFWPSWDAKGIDNRVRVEPDVFIRFHEIDLILEAKRYDANQQSEDQLSVQLRTYHKMYWEENKSLYYIQLGGLHSSSDEKDIIVDKKNIKICKTDWSRLLAEVNNEYEKLKATDFIVLSPSKRILSDVISAFNIHQYYKINWLEKINTPSINTPSLKTFFEYGKN